MKNISKTLMFIIIILFLFSVVIQSCTTKSEDIHTCNSVSMLQKVCIEGHLYYKTIGYLGDSLAPVLNNDGTPVKCTGGID